MKKRSFACLLSVLMMLASWPAGALAQAETREGVYDQTLVVGADGFSDLQAALDSLEGQTNGRVLVLFTEDFTARSNGVYQVPADKGVTSVTLGAPEGKEVSVGGSYVSFDLCANGVPLIIDSGVLLGASGKVYGGGSEAASVSGGTRVTVNQGAAVQGALYGGGKNSAVTGNVELTVNGTVGSVHGGGRAMSVTADVDKTVNADVKGNVKITLGAHSTLNGDLYGGGNAYSSAEGVSADQLQANVTGNVTIHLSCPAVKGGNIYGGGQAYLVTGGGVRTLRADVGGSVTIGIGGEMQFAPSARGQLYGGGRAQALPSDTDPNSVISARVEKSVRIDASKDNDASAPHDEWDDSMFQRLYGGGFAKGVSTDATVYSTSVITSRKALDNASGLFGGGYAETGGTARVETNTSVEVCRAATQADGHDNAKNVFGGGHGSYNGDASVSGNATVTIHGPVTFEPGGYVYGGGWKSSDGGNADVKGTATVIMRGATHPNGVSAGGKGGSVTNAATVQCIGACTLSLRTAGGSITEGVTVVIGDGATDTTVNAKYIYSADSVSSRIAKVEVKDKASLIQQSNTNHLFWNTEDLIVEKGGLVQIDNTSANNESISGTLSGEGTITLPVGKQIVVNGGLDGTLKLAVSGTPVAGAYAWSPREQPGQFIYDGAGYLLEKTDTGSWYRWDLAVAKTVTASATNPEGGSVSPETQTVPVGGAADVTIARNPGYKVVSVLVDGVDQTASLQGDVFSLSDV